jgi:phage internal scaffolding protein
MELQRKVPRKQIDCSGVSKTDQSYKKAVNINNIIKKFKKTGVLPETRQGVYGDYSQVPTLEEAHEAVKMASEAFMSLPATVRKLMDNDPSKLELWLSDEANYDIAVENGLLEKKPDAPAKIMQTKDELTGEPLAQPVEVK